MLVYPKVSVCVWNIPGYIIDFCKTYCGWQFWIKHVVCEPQEKTGEEKSVKTCRILNKT